MVAIALSSLAVASSFFALVRAAAPWPSAPTGGVFNAGTKCNVTWLAATDSNWNLMSLELMSGPNLAMVPVMPLATGLDGSKDGVFFYDCPEVDINGPIYFIQFNSSESGVTPIWTTRFTIASANGKTVPAPNATQPDGSPPAWGTGHVISGFNATGNATTSGNVTASGTGTSSTGASRSTSHALTPTGTPTSNAASGSPTSGATPNGGSGSGAGAGSGSGPNAAEPTVTSTTTTTVIATSTATRFTTEYIQSFVTVTATPSVVTATATSTTTVTATPSPSPANNAKAAATSASSGALRRADLPVMHLLAFAVGSATAFITLLA